MKECRHIAIIMDGNGRWAKARNLPRSAGHAAGAEKVRETAIDAAAKGIEYLTLYAFSTENWKRSADEVSYLMKLPGVFFKKYMQELMERGMRIRILGDVDELPADTRRVLLEAVKESENNTGLTLAFAVNYGSHREILRAAKRYAEDVRDGKADLDMDEAGFEKYLYTEDMPPVDLLIRTSGEQRISNYLLWQIAYAELEFIPEAWPDFSEEVLQRCIDEYYTRDRRFGGVKS